MHLSRRLKCTFVITRCPSSVRLSLTFHIFDFSSETTEQNSRKLYRKQEPNILYQVCVFRADRKNKMAALASDWLRHFQLLLWNGWKEFQWNLTGSKISTSPTKFVFFGLIGKTRWLPWTLISWDIFNFSSETAEQNSTKLDRKQDLNVLYQVCVFQADGKNKMAALASDWLRHYQLLLWNRWTEFQWNLTGSKISTSSTKFMFFWPIRKTRWPPWPLYGWETFDFSCETAEQNSTKLDRKQDLNVLYQVCVFRPIRKTRWPSWPLIGWDMQLLLWNRWTEFKETWQEARSQCPLPSLCFSGRSVNKNVRLGRFLKKMAHCTQVHDMGPFGPLVMVMHLRSRSLANVGCTEILCFAVSDWITAHNNSNLKSHWLNWILFGKQHVQACTKCQKTIINYAMVNYLDICSSLQNKMSWHLHIICIYKDTCTSNL